MRMMAAGLAALFVGALGGTAFAESTLDQIQDEEQPGSRITIQGQGPLRRLLEPAPEPALPLQQTGVPLIPYDGSLRPLRPPAEADPGIPNGSDDGANFDALDDPDAPPDQGAADDLSGPDDDDPIPNE
jgi:hypothetical protein